MHVPGARLRRVGGGRWGKSGASPAECRYCRCPWIWLCFTSARALLTPSAESEEMLQMPVDLVMFHIGPEIPRHALSEAGSECTVPPTLDEPGEERGGGPVHGRKDRRSWEAWACERVGESAAAPAVRSPSAEVEKGGRCASKVSWHLTQISVCYFRDVHLPTAPGSRGSFYVYIRSTRSPEQLAVHYGPCT